MGIYSGLEGKKDGIIMEKEDATKPNQKTGCHHNSLFMLNKKRGKRNDRKGERLILGKENNFLPFKKTNCCPMTIFNSVFFYWHTIYFGTIYGF